MRFSTGTAIAIAAALALPAAAVAQVQPYRANDAGGFGDVLPPGTSGFASTLQLGSFLLTGARPPHSDDQIQLYRDTRFKDASFGVRPGDVARTYSPRSDVVVMRDRSYGVPHVYGATRAGAMFALGYVTAEDRMFFIDILRNVGRATLASFAGGSQGNRELDRDQWRVAPYTEADLQRQIEEGAAAAPDGRGAMLRDDLRNYVAGINQYIREARLNPLKIPGEYPAIGRPLGPADWRETDTVAVSALVGGLLATGGGAELDNAVALREFRRRFRSRRDADRHFAWFRAADDPEAPRVLQSDRRFPYLGVPRRPRGTALPDAGSLRAEPLRIAASGSGAARNRAPGVLGRLGGLRAAFPSSSSNALVVSASESASGRPLAVFGPQVAYFAPQVLMEQDVHAPGIDARGAAFPGANLYVHIGRGRDYAWSATSGGNDATDTFAVPLCEPGGGRPTLASRHYSLRGECLPFEVLERRNAWRPNLADSTPEGSETLRVLRTRVGLVSHRGTVRGRPVAFTTLRATYLRETESGAGFAELNDPGRIRGPRDFQRAASQINATFNWLYADSRSVAYFNSGRFPARDPRANPDFPVFAERGWRGVEPARLHPQAVGQRYFASWNGKQALGHRAADSNWSSSAVDRVQMLTRRIESRVRGSRRTTLAELVGAMADAATVDLRGQEVLPWALRVLGRPRDPALRRAADVLRGWVRAGAHRRDRDGDGRYEDAEAVALMDAWWPELVAGTFRRALGLPLFEVVRDRVGLGDLPHSHLGSAFDDGIWGQVQKDLRRALGRRVRFWPRRAYCGRGSLRRCRADLGASLRRALPADPARLYRGDGCDAGDQVCWDEIRFQTAGAITLPPLPWVNRPTYQQAVEVGGAARP